MSATRIASTALDDETAPRPLLFATSIFRRVATIGWRNASCRRHSNGAIGACGGRRAAAELELDRLAAASMHLSSCATARRTILVKTLAQLYRRAIQALPPSNYHRFVARRARLDFEADNVANILLARAYGCPCRRAASWGIERCAHPGAVRRTGCNLIFAERAQHRRTDRANMGIEERWSEMEWRFCRRRRRCAQHSPDRHGSRRAVAAHLLQRQTEQRRGRPGAGVKDRSWSDRGPSHRHRRRRPICPTTSRAANRFSPRDGRPRHRPSQMIRSRRSKHEAEIVQSARRCLCGLMRERALRRQRRCNYGCAGTANQTFQLLQST